MVPEGWKLTSLKEACNNQLQTGPFGSQLHSHEYVDEGIPVLMPKDLNDFRANIETAAKITEERGRDLKKHWLQKGDILFSRRGDVARFALIDEQASNAICGTGCLRVRASDQYYPKYLSYFLQLHQVRKWLEQNSVGQTMPNMNTEILGELPLKLATNLKEQKKIAQTLSTWDKAITTTEQLLANSQQQKKALMQQLLTGKKRLLDDNGQPYKEKWEMTQLNKLLSIHKGKQINRNTLSKVGTYAVINGGIQPSGYTESFNEEGNTITISEGGNSCGYVAFQKNKFWCGGHCYALKESKLVIEFLYQALKVNESKIMQLRVGSGLPNIQKKDLDAFKISFPNNQVEQKKIAAVLSSADQEIDSLQQKIEALKQEKKALMQQLLTGKRRVNIN